ncbi:MAG: DUF4215 domain-containing protein [Myxococcota bacterium]|nr:DUF4215 domain-containing protein [Myxococcota bacterium]
MVTSPNALKFIRRFLLLGLVSTTVIHIGCADEGARAGTQAAVECAKNDLVDQCPPNTEPRLELDATSACTGAGSIDLSQGAETFDGAAAVQNACVGSSTCKLICELMNPCQWGVSQISPTEGILCAAAPEGCGNGTCDDGETPESCPNDCEMECMPGLSRCQGNAVQNCNLRGQWENALACPAMQRCEQAGANQAQCVGVGCGNGRVDAGEECDDGNLDDGDGCDSNCTNTRCGNGLITEGEICDDGNDVTTDSCVQCQPARCGDGSVHEGVEECDDANADDSDGCTAACELSFCGNGRVDGDEECDNGVENADTGECTSTCRLARCGDGLVHADVEQCDDGPSNNDTARCTSQCTQARCGDGFTRRDIADMTSADYEECDEGPGNADTEQCTSLCRRARCGDGLVWNGRERCDDGNDSNTDACLVGCRPARCGDGFTHEGQEECDDGNVENADACTNECENARCGDGIERTDLDLNDLGQPGFEACDDGNDNDVDGCTNDCFRREIEDNDHRSCDSNPIPAEGKWAVVGVLEAASNIDADNSQPGSDTFTYTHQCGLDEGELCPMNRRAVLNFTLRYVPPDFGSLCRGTNPAERTGITFSRIDSDSGHCCRRYLDGLLLPADECQSWLQSFRSIFPSRNPPAQAFFISEAYSRNPGCVRGTIVDVDFCERRGADGQCCTGLRPPGGRCCVPGEDRFCQAVGEANLPYRYARWTKTVEYHGDYHFSLKNASQQSFDYRLVVDVGEGD